jgi:phosphoribosylformimino-5-aminoimidazole carboxamide ribotide isomerase
MQVIPAVDVLDGLAVRLARGDYNAVTRYSDDPIAVVEGWAAEGAELVHVVDLEGARSGVPDFGLIVRLGSLGIPIQYGGGIRTAGAAETALAAGLSRIVVGSVLLTDEARSFVADLDPRTIVAGIDVRLGRARGSGWRDEGLDADEALDRVLSLGLTSTLVTGIEADGTMDGPDLRLLEQFRLAAPEMRLIASGGVGVLRDLEAVAAIGADAVIVGRALYEQRFTLAEAVATASGDRTP